MFKFVSLKLSEADWALVQKIMVAEDSTSVSKTIRDCIRKAEAQYSEGMKFCFGRWVTEAEWNTTILARAEQDPTWIVKENGFADIDHNDKIIAKVKKLARESQ